MYNSAETAIPRPRLSRPPESGNKPRWDGALTHRPPAKARAVITNHATGTIQVSRYATPTKTSTAATQVARASTAHRSVSRAITRALALAASSPASRNAQKSTDSPPIAVATLNAPNERPTTRTTSAAGSRGPPQNRAIAWYDTTNPA